MNFKIIAFFLLLCRLFYEIGFDLFFCLLRQVNSPEREIYRDPDVIRADDRIDEVVHTDTARKMLSIFRQMEENASKEDLPDGPKPLKRFTPPPEDKFARPSGSDTEDDEEDGEESADDDSAEEKDPNYVRASDKVIFIIYFFIFRLMMIFLFNFFIHSFRLRMNF